MEINSDENGSFQMHFSHHSVTIQSTKWQAYFSNLSADGHLKKIRLKQLDHGSKNQRECMPITRIIISNIE